VKAPFERTLENQTLWGVCGQYGTYIFLNALPPSSFPPPSLLPCSLSHSSSLPPSLLPPSLLPSKDLLLQPQVVQNVVTKKHRKGLISKHHSDAHAHDMPVIFQGETVRVLLQPNVPNSAWSLGICTDQKSDRSYEVLVHGNTYRRNRKHIRPVDQTLRPSPPKTPEGDGDWGRG